MRYYVVAEDGNKYGPADAAMLNHWIEEGRLLPGMMLEEDGTKHRVAAASVSGLDFYVLDDAKEEVPLEPPTPRPVAHEPIEPPPHESLAVDLALAFGMGALTLLFTVIRSTAGFLGLFTFILGVTAGIKSRERGSEAGGAAVVLNMIALVAWIAIRAYYSLKT